MYRPFTAMVGENGCGKSVGRYVNRFPHEFSGGQRQRIILTGDVPSPIDPPPGCRFHTRCPIA